MGVVVREDDLSSRGSVKLRINNLQPQKGVTEKTTLQLEHLHARSIVGTNNHAHMLSATEGIMR